MLFSFTAPLVKMRLERSAERDKREIINNRSSIHAQSNAEGILNCFACKAPVFSLIHNFAEYLLGKLPPGTFMEQQNFSFASIKGARMLFSFITL